MYGFIYDNSVLDQVMAINHETTDQPCDETIHDDVYVNWTK